MTPWKRICCAVEFSEPSRIAMLTAEEGRTEAAGLERVDHGGASRREAAPRGEGR